MTLEIINAQGAQVEALKQALKERDAVIKVLAAQVKVNNLRVKKANFEKINKDVVQVNWKQLQDGTIVVNIKRARKEGKK